MQESLVISLLSELVAVHSVSSVSNVPLLEKINDILDAAGWSSQILTYGSEGMANMIATPRAFADSLPHVDIAFVCHTDTVPYLPRWKEALTVREQEGFLHGCGTCDVKGSMAGLLAAAISTPVSSITRSVAFVFTAQEEIGCVGANHLVSSGAILPKATVVCEPTSLQPARAGKGYGLAYVTVTGREAHSALPACGVSAIHAAARFIDKIGDAILGDAPLNNPLFNPPWATWNVGTIQGGTAKNILAENCEFLVEWRPLPEDDPTRIGRILEKIGKNVSEQFPGTTVHVDVRRADPGFSSSEDSSFVSLMCKTLKRNTTGIAFGSEATRMLRVCNEAIVVGPGDMETAHSERECVPVADLEEWVAVLQNLLVAT